MKLFYRLVIVGICCWLAGCASTPEPVDDVDAEALVDEVEAEEGGDWSIERPVDRQAQWVLEMVNERGGEFSEEEMDERFSDLIHQAMTYEQFSLAMTQVASTMAPFEVIEVYDRPSDEALLLSVRGADGQRYTMVVAVENEDPHKMTGVQFQPAPVDDEDLATSWEEIESSLQGIGEERQLLAARIDDGICTPVFEVDTDKTLALGSTFKLYVLAALVEAVTRGDIDYDQMVAIEEAHKSLPSGILQDEEVGSEHSVFEMAKLMISISDNTATDHLIALLGRQVVEEQIAALGHRTPERNSPFLFTHEMMKLKVALGDSERDEFVAMASDERREYLDSELVAMDLPAVDDAMDWHKPRHIDSIEWFASADELCSLFAYFSQGADSDEEGFEKGLEAMAENDGGMNLGEKANYVGFKGGSEPGVLNLSWLIEGEDGGWYVVVVGANDTDEAIEMNELHALGRAAGRLVLQADDQ